jgi:hypothetical protein
MGWLLEPVAHVIHMDLDHFCKGILVGDTGVCLDMGIDLLVELVKTEVAKHRGSHSNRVSIHNTYSSEGDFSRSQAGVVTNVESREVVNLLELVTITDSDPAAIERAGLVNNCKVVTNVVVIDSVSLADVRAANRDHCKGLSVKLGREVSEFSPAIGLGSHGDYSRLGVKFTGPERFRLKLGQSQHHRRLGWRCQIWGEGGR